jgi:hypothetical protein
MPDNRTASARDDLPRAGPPGVEPGPARLELAVLSVYTTGLRERTARLERASPEWRSGALPTELRPRSGTPGWSRTSVLCRRRAALSALSYGRREEPPAGVEPALRPYKGRVLAVHTTEARRWRRRESNPLLLGASEVLFRLSYIPTVRTDGVEPSQPGAPRLQRGELARCSASARKWGDRPGSNRRRGAHNPGCFRLHHGHHGAGTTGLEPAASRLTSERSARLSYAPEVARVGFEPTVSSS